MPMIALRLVPRFVAAAMASTVCACSSIGPATVPRDRGDYGAAIGDSWKQQTLLNIIKLRYGDFPIFMEIAQVIAGYQIQTTATAGFAAQNFITTSVGGPPAIAGSAGVGATYIDRPTVIYAPLTGNDFIKTLMRPIPPVAVLFLLQSGYPATVVMPVAVDSINGVTNESKRAGMTRPGDPEFGRLAQLLFELQRANALQIRIERSKDNAEVSIIGFPPTNVAPEVAAKIAEMRRILHLAGSGRSHQVRYGGWSGKGDEIAMTTRSMLQVMVELGVLAQVPEADIAGGKASPGAGSVSPSGSERPPLLNILSGTTPPPDAYAAVAYKGRWFWIADTDIRSKTMFSGVMLLFSISDVGVRSPAPVVTVPAN
ncbi:hypothetical protein [Reyranella sp.]|uniref:hypothetical protein n=1 Tax=Reyranella sp. TaxID=1929291 RepID=UPI003D1534CF